MSNRLKTNPAFQVKCLMDSAAVHFRAGLYQKSALDFEKAAKFGSWKALAGLSACKRQLGDLDRALSALKKAISVCPTNATLRNNLGVLYEAREEFCLAKEEFITAINISPEMIVAHYNLGNLYARQNDMAMASQYYKKTCILDPTHLRAMHNLGTAYFRLGLYQDAIENYEKVLSLEPDRTDTLLQLGLCQCAAEEPQQAAETYLSLIERQRRPGATDDLDKVMFRCTNKVKLIHDREQIEFLIKEGVIGSEMKRLAEAFGDVLATAPKGIADTTFFEIPKDAPQIFTAHYNRLFHMHKEDTLPVRSLNPEVLWSDIDSNFNRYAIVDEALISEALEGLQRLCYRSTIWFQIDFVNEVSSTIFNGLSSALFFQIAAELRKAMPNLLSNRPLTGGWAYKYLGDGSNVGIHADAGEITVNLWITPDEANLTPLHGGLRLSNTRLPVEYLGKPDDAQQVFIDDVLDDENLEWTSIPYKCNRVVIFESTLAHTTDSFRFKSDYKSRRINLTFLFGTPAGPEIGQIGGT